MPRSCDWCKQVVQITTQIDISKTKTPHMIRVCGPCRDTVRRAISRPVIPVDVMIKG